MIRLFILQLLLLPSLSSCFLSYGMTVLGKSTLIPYDNKNLIEIKEKRICSIQEIEKFDETNDILKSRIDYMDNYLISGLVMDIGLGIYGISYGIANSSALITGAGAVWLIASPFAITEAEEVKQSYINTFEYSNSGWLKNKYGVCSNTQDFYLYYQFRRRKKMTCGEELEEWKTGFYESLKRDSQIHERNLRQMIEIVGEPIVLKNEEIEDDCEIKLYIQFEGGRKELVKALSTINRIEL
ncbi:MAG: hypothetical protein KDK54_20080 [Leptospiraceae bacterium]|nr:hypothetical protein [Leptospiraceae bacterium]